MDDPNAALPSDPTVDESYTKGSRPARRKRAQRVRHPRQLDIRSAAAV